MLIQPGCYLDPGNDHAFRRIFGDEKREPVLRQFLNSMLRLKGAERIQRLRIADPHQVPPIQELKESILDIRCWDQHKRNFLVEMQMWDQKSFEKRALYNAAKLFVDQLGKGEDYGELHKVTLLSILNFPFLASKSYLADHMIIDPVTGEHRLKDLGFTFLQLPKFLKKEEELATLEEKWVYFFKHARETPVGRIPATLRAVPEIAEAFAVLEEIGLDRHELDLYRKADMARRDRVSQLETSYDKGHKKGLTEGEKKGKEKGLVEGEKKGREEGLVEGEKKGKEEGLELAAARMLKEGMDNATVARVTGLSQQRIEHLSRQEN